MLVKHEMCQGLSGIRQPECVKKELSYSLQQNEKGSYEDFEKR